MSLKYKRIMLKISGEALAGKKSFGLDSDTLSTIAQKVKECSDMGCEIAIVVGGGNFWRGRTGEGMDRTRADHMGMLATVINSLALLDALEHHGVSARVQTAIEMRQIAEPYIRLKAMRHLEKGRVVKAAAGRDKGSYFVITEMEENYVFIADGKRRKLSLPKRKNLKHLRFTDNVIELNDMTDKKLRNVLSRYAAAHTVTDMGRY